ncbi:ParB/RepB/Spo0J family partition protein [bacterium]|nr:ParB/RepB/Spo0J family partition protein [bacterium]
MKSTAKNKPVDPQHAAPALAIVSRFESLAPADVSIPDWNPRGEVPTKSDAFAELVMSVREQGILEPLIVRPAPPVEGKAKGKGKKDAAAFEIVVGCRRYHAARSAGLVTIPCIVREDLAGASPEALTAIALIENGHRADLTPLQEVVGILLMAKTHQPGEIASKIGRPVAFVTKRLHLAKLSPKARKMLEAGKLELGAAMYLARAGAADRQDAILKGIPDWCVRNNDGVVDVDAVERSDFAGKHQLTSAPFALDAEPSCASCVHNTAAMADLFGGDGERNGTCLNVSCFDAKSKAEAEAAAVDFVQKKTLADTPPIATAADLDAHNRGQSYGGKSPFNDVTEILNAKLPKGEEPPCRACTNLKMGMRRIEHWQKGGGKLVPLFLCNNGGHSSVIQNANGKNPLPAPECFKQQAAYLIRLQKAAERQKERAKAEKDAAKNGEALPAPISAKEALAAEKAERNAERTENVVREILEARVRDRFTAAPFPENLFDDRASLIAIAWQLAKGSWSERGELLARAGVDPKDLNIAQDASDYLFQFTNEELRRFIHGAAMKHTFEGNRFEGMGQARLLRFGHLFLKRPDAGQAQKLLAPVLSRLPKDVLDLLATYAVAGDEQPPDRKKGTLVTWLSAKAAAGAWNDVPACLTDALMAIQKETEEAHDRTKPKRGAHEVDDECGDAMGEDEFDDEEAGDDAAAL